MAGSYIDRAFGREAFGLDPAGYDAARPAYPEWVFEVLRDRCGAGPGAGFEIGPGTGTATRRLLELGVEKLVAVEADPRLAAFLRESIPDTRLTVLSSAFEEAVLEEGRFDLGVSATAFHWLEEDAALKKVAKLLRPGGWWAMVWNVFGDASLPDPFHEATKRLLGEPRNPSAGAGDVPFALDAEARIVALERAGTFDGIEQRTSKWTLMLDPEQTAALYATYSNVVIRPDRDEVLNELRRIARDEFEGRVTRNMITSLYVARRLV